MGLLEKASNIQTEEEPKTVVLKTPKPVPEPKPIKEPKTTSKKAKKARRSKRKKIKAPREQRTLPDGFEVATTGQRITRRVCDFAVSYGWSVPMLAITAWGSNFNPTPFVILGLALIIFNLYFMPRYAGNRSVGNWISRTRYVNSRGTAPIWVYMSLKGLTTVFVILGLMTLLTLTSGGFPTSTSGQILSAVGLILLIPPLLDYTMYKLRKESGQGLWDSVFGGVWLVRTVKSTEAKGWLKRLEAIGDFTESKGWLADQETKD